MHSSKTNNAWSSPTSPPFSIPGGPKVSSSRSLPTNCTPSTKHSSSLTMHTTTSHTPASARTGHQNAGHTRTVATPQQSAWPYSHPLSSATTKSAVQPTNLVLQIIPPPLCHSNSNNLRQASQSQHQCNIKTKSNQIKSRQSSV